MFMEVYKRMYGIWTCVGGCIYMYVWNVGICLWKYINVCVECGYMFVDVYICMYRVWTCVRVYIYV